ncbi:TIGR03986 family type III CRISPR-associated RAMP protein [Gloeobacter kilaueensis]|uniref:CRISPR type III-associated protein domain-containing protein n=1 Tax=Gloeobacter kilaueensis (strain ATCC BAA-2537 / CCAP 1431/1 / ULC 316 / JS1) TaxID=1183438 RepID=U5QLN9_GLOK1|nr:TIGR03986 family CRISPR-associated RAMP protein [Gloeobacter kilaueensis]AGY58605.1 hypothetical protein GKIL_2359 [Gloeobacter kilaueensis JS1]
MTHSRFHNPYNFVPAPPRRLGDRHLGDAIPPSHHRLHPDRYSGRIAVTLTTVTPLLLLDTARVSENDQTKHKTYPLRLGADGRPYLPPTSLKGMLRSAYEAVTNSRLSVFFGHDKRLAYRMPARDGLSLVPVRIEGNQIQILLGTNNNLPALHNGHWQIPNSVMYAAWLPRYDTSTGEVSAATAVGFAGMQHGDLAGAWLEEIERLPRSPRQRPFKYWRVRKLVRAGENLGRAPQPSRPSRYHVPTGRPMREQKGYVCLTGGTGNPPKHNIDGKHDERLFFSTADPLPVAPLTADLKTQWRELIRNYQSIHAEERRQNRSGPPALAHSHWSRQVVGGESETELKTGTLCYAAVDRDHEGRYGVYALYPVMISRALYDAAPIDLLDASLHPATALQELSPAERVFGWVNQDGTGSYRGNLRIGPVTCTADDAAERFAIPGVPLAILGQPKPQQIRFYVAEDVAGRALQANTPKEDGYMHPYERIKRSLRGRKVYPHHANLSQNYWNSPTQDRTQRELQEYRRPENGTEPRDDQNRSILGWVKPERQFRFDIDITNLSEVELGALLWLLDLPERHYHRLGGGKPLGFGSVRLSIDWSGTDLRTGTGWSEYYADLLAQTTSSLAATTGPVAAFKKAVASTYGNSQPFERVRFIAAFLRSAQGYGDGLPIYYPRITPHANPAGESYRWFTANEDPKRRKSLPDLADGPHGLNLP